MSLNLKLKKVAKVAVGATAATSLLLMLDDARFALDDDDSSDSIVEMLDVGRGFKVSFSRLLLFFCIVTHKSQVQQ